ncbi:MAG: hypothetical protein K1T65_08045 [Candidatus Aramenus sp.]|nr:hypothetical protein [Candidatus Aramenus sp.]
MNKGTFWLAAAGVTVLQMLIGNVMTYYAPYPPLLGAHAFLAGILLLLALFGLRFAEKGREKRIVMGNILLVVLISALGLAFLQLQSNVVILLHFLLSIGLVSNFSVLYGIYIGKREAQGKA